MMYKHLRYYLISFLFLLSVNGNVFGQLLVDNFEYTGQLNANGWDIHSGTTNFISTTSGLTYTGYSGSGVGNAALVSNLGGEDVNKAFTEQNVDGSTIYFSALVNINDTASTKTGDYFLHIGDRVSGTSFTLFSARVFAKITSDVINFGISNTSTATYGTTSFAKNTTFLLIVKYTINAAGNDEVKLWVVPSGIPTNEGSAGTPEVTNTSLAGQNIIDAVGIRQGSSSTSPQVVLDGIRIATTWSDLFPPVVPSNFSALLVVSDGWNLIAFPGMHPNSMSPDTLYRGRDITASVFKYTSSGYAPVTSLVNQEGYWLKHSGIRTYNWNGTVQSGILYPKLNYATVDTIDAFAGWNIIGVYEYPILPSNLVTIPSGLITNLLFQYTPGTGYGIASLLNGGLGYWVFMNSAGKIVLPGRTTDQPVVEKSVLIDKNWGRIIITDSQNRSFTLYTSGAKNNQAANYLLPPAPPAGELDIRYSTQKLVEDLNSDQTIDIRDAVYPIKVRIENSSIHVKDGITSKLVNNLLKDGEEIIINDNSINKLVVNITETLPVTYNLEQNFPNPFNPTTTIRFAIPEANIVTLKVYNTIGEEVATLVNEKKEIGSYSINFNSSNLASGIYLYKLQAGDFVQTKKMILMK